MNGDDDRGKQDENRASGLSRLYTDQRTCEVAVRQGRIRNTDTHSDACLVPTQDTPPVNPLGREGPYLSVHATRQTMQDSLTQAGRRITQALPIVLGSSETVEPCAAPQAVRDGVCDTLPA